MMNRQNGFLLLESSVSLLMACLGLVLLFTTYGQTKKIENNMDKRVDRAYAYYVLSQTKVDKLVVHDHIYRQASGKKIFDQTEEQVYDVK
ncbi:type II secretion system protein [Lactobacillus sp. PV037]|uniref:type II secretion system protein n=1 Tax=Lactobacillus sp. PV037 TaxID=2594496 RepID=UPI00223ED320|nr:type II secretion system protein [Lactobacillus sp. PV037]QNQ83369.1 type II secretion system protein [Lactobacillus sp. PV037]